MLLAVLLLAAPLCAQDKKPVPADAPKLSDADKAKIALLQRKTMQIVNSMQQMQQQMQQQYNEEQKQAVDLSKQIQAAIAEATKTWDAKKWQLNSDTLEPEAVAVPAEKK